MSSFYIKALLCVDAGQLFILVNMPCKERIETLGIFDIFLYRFKETAKSKENNAMV